MSVTEESSLNRSTASSPGAFAPPWLGLLAFSVAFLWKPVAHTVSVANQMIFGAGHYASAAVIGIIGFVMIWTGFRKDELSATLFGFMGGSFVFLGLVEPSFWLFGEILKVPPLIQDGVYRLSPNLLLMQASSISFFVLLIFLGADKDTKCRMFLWFHKNLRLRPNPPTPGYRRQAARITALETVMISWFFYILIIALLDPRIVGRDHPFLLAFFWAMFAWGVYLCVFKLARARAMAPAIRYAIPVAGIIWFNWEVAAQLKWYTEVWIMPREYPVACVTLGILFLAAMVQSNRATWRGGAADPLPGAVAAN